MKWELLVVDRGWFLQQVSTGAQLAMQSAVLAMIDSVRSSVRRSVCPTQSNISCQNYDHAVSLHDSRMTLVSSWLTSPQNSKGNMGSGDIEWEKSKNRQFFSRISETVQDRTIVTMMD